MTYCRQCGRPLQYDTYFDAWEANDYTTCNRTANHVPETEEDLRDAAGIADYDRDKEN